MRDEGLLNVEDLGEILLSEIGPKAQTSERAL
jgi:hypothetical protein